MLNEQTHQKLVAMKLFGLDAAFQGYLDAGAGNRLAFEERFGLMVDREWQERQERRLKLRLGKAKLREPACPEDINYRHPRGLDKSVVQRLLTCQWASKHENVILTGPTGIGKTWLACALANATCREGYSARYARTPRLLQSLQLARADGSYDRQFNRLGRTDVLILDDWGIAPLADAERRELLEIIEERHGRRSTVVTSQLPVEKWHAFIGDNTLADSILDRLVHVAHRIKLKGPSVRGEPKKDPSDTKGAKSKA
ncbi:MAG: IS21-like element helper ATPase IstB [Thermoleophilia bacterium]|nr:IS21-like element helper ATPase IstB [Thermoleophilia bacterium]